MKEYKAFTECVDFVGSACKPFQGKKKYISTGTVNVSSIDATAVEIVDYQSKPSRANLEVEVGDVLFAKMQGTKKALLINPSLVNNIYSTGFCAVRAKKGVLAESCLYHLLTSQTFLTQKNKFCSGATQKAITNAELKKIRISVPSLEIQDQVAETLNTVNAIIQKRQQELSALDDLVKARFVEMFGVFPNNPLGWKTGTIRDVVSSVRYGSSRPAVEGGRYPYLRMNNITYDGELDLTDTKKIDIPDNELDKCTVRRGDVLFNRTNSKELVGKTCVYDRDEPMVLAGFVIRVRLNELMLPEFLSAFLNTDFSKRMLLGMCKAAIGQANINAQEMQNIGIYIPPIELQREFLAFKNKINKSKLAVQQALDKTQLLFDSLMQKYFG